MATKQQRKEAFDIMEHINYVDYEMALEIAKRKDSGEGLRKGLLMFEIAEAMASINKKAHDIDDRILTQSTKYSYLRYLIGPKHYAIIEEYGFPMHHLVEVAVAMYMDAWDGKLLPVKKD
jgi:hypothetical protein